MCGKKGWAYLGGYLRQDVSTAIKSDVEGGGCRPRMLASDDDDNETALNSRSDAWGVRGWGYAVSVCDELS